MKRYGAWLWLAVVIAAVAYLALRAMGGITFDSNILALLPRAERDPSAQNVRDKIAESFSRRVVFLVGDASSAKATTAAGKHSAALERSGTVSAITSRRDPDAQRKMGAAYFPYRSGLLAPSDRAALLAGDGQALVSRALSILYGAGGFANGKLLSHDPFLLLPAYFMSLPVPQSKVTMDNGVLSVHDGATTYVLVSADLAGNPYATKFQSRFIETVDKTFLALKTQTPSLILLQTGAIFYAHEGTRTATHETSIIGVASVLAMLALIFLVFRSPRPIALGFVAIGTGILCAFVGALAIFNHVHTVALLLGVSLIGISVDYSLQYFCEYFDEAATDRQARIRRVLPGIAVGLGATLIGYFTLLLAPLPGLRQVAVVSMIGLTASFLTVALWYPILDTRHGLSGGERLLELSALHWRLWEEPRFKWIRIATILLCAIAAGVGAFFLKADDDVRHMQSLSTGLKHQEAEIERLTGVSTKTDFLLVEGPSEEVLLETEEKLAPLLHRAQTRGALGSYASISQFVPSISRQKENRTLIRNKLSKPYLARYLKQIGYQGKIESAFSNAYLLADDLPKVGPLAMLSTLDISAPGHPAHVVLLQNVHDPLAIKALIADVPGVRLVSLVDDWSRLFGQYRRYAIAVPALSALLMLPLLWWRYGWRRGLRVLLPPLTAILFTPPIAALAGITFTFFNAMALILVLSVGIDYSVFCCETSGARKPVTTLAIALAALCTMLSFGMLALSSVFAVHAFGVTMLIGIFFAFFFAPAAGSGAVRTKVGA
jgi:predicted exporter